MDAKNGMGLCFLKKTMLVGWLVGLEFSGLVNTIKVMWSRSVYLTKLFLGKFDSSKWLTSTCTHSFVSNG